MHRAIYVHEVAPIELAEPLPPSNHVAFAAAFFDDDNEAVDDNNDDDDYGTGSAGGFPMDQQEDEDATSTNSSGAVTKLLITPLPGSTTPDYSLVDRFQEYAHSGLGQMSPTAAFKSDVRLLELLKISKANISLFNDIKKWARTSVLAGVNFIDTKSKGRAAVLSDYGIRELKEDGFGRTAIDG